MIERASQRLHLAGEQTVARHTSQEGRAAAAGAAVLQQYGNERAPATAAAAPVGAGHIYPPQMHMHVHT